MKVNKFTKGVIAATALVAASAAQADLLSSAKVTASNLKLNIFDSETGGSQLFLGSGFTTTGDNIAFGGTSVSTSLNNNGEQQAADPGNTTGNFSLSSTQNSSLSEVHSEANVLGSIFEPVSGATGTTYSYTDVGGYDFGETNSQIANSLTATFSFTPLADAWAELSFDWLLDVIVQTSWSGGSGNADWALQISLAETCPAFTVCAPDLFSFKLSDVLGFSSTGEVFENNTTVGTGGPLTNSVSTADRMQLMSGESYTLKIVQNANTAGFSVSEPMSLGIFAMGLLGLAGLSRKSKK